MNENIANSVKAKRKHVNAEQGTIVLCVETVHDGPKSKDMVKTQSRPRLETNVVK